MHPWRWSLNLINGTVLGQGIMFALTALGAILLILGYRTRLMSIIVWVMVVSIQARNPFILSGADTLLRVLLFWAMLLPLGAVWSIDSQAAAARQRVLAMRFLSFGTVGLFLQIAFMYWFTAALKTSPIWRTDGTALYYALGAGHLTRPFGAWLRQSDLLKVLSHASLGREVVAPFLLFLPFFTGPVRTMVAASFMAFQFGIFLMMDVGIFPWVSAFCMVCFLPGWFWDNALPRLQRAMRVRFAFAPPLRQLPHPTHASWSGLRAVAGGGVLGRLALSGADGGALWPQPRSEPTLTRERSADSPATPSLPYPRSSGPEKVRSLAVTNLFAIACLLVVFGQNMSAVSAYALPEEARSVGYGLGLNQRWNMFAPQPPVSTVWYVVKGELQNGQTIDLLTPIVHDDLGLVRPVSWERPDDIVGEYYRDKYWRKYFHAIVRDGNQAELREFVAYACRTWNAHYGGEVTLERVRIFLLSERTLPEGEVAPVRRSLVDSFTCT